MQLLLLTDITLRSTFASRNVSVYNSVVIGFRTIFKAPSLSVCVIN